MFDILTSNPLLGGVVAIVAVYAIYKLLGVVSFLIRLGLSVAIGAALFYYFVK